MERRKAEPKHMFHDPKYQEEKSQVLENIGDAVKTGTGRILAFVCVATLIKGEFHLQSALKAPSLMMT